MGFVVSEEIANLSGLPQILPDDLLAGSKSRGAVGNAMHLANATVILAVALACTRPISEEEAAFHQYVDSSST